MVQAFNSENIEHGEVVATSSRLSFMVWSQKSQINGCYEMNEKAILTVWAQVTWHSNLPEHIPHI